ncbi:MAG: PKD domain-containing protein [Euryarchaeota archaeon]|nr:PKD domain-containing protein [Euryarchaeota archaeon]MDE1879528.1 PKD domain-containing protein [Euryarchaeota archaeon]
MKELAWVFVGLALVVVGLVSGAGGLSVVGVKAPPLPTELIAQFNWTASGFNVTVTLHNTFPSSLNGPALSTFQSVNFGDGSPSMSVTGSTARHTYTTSGAYSVTDFISVALLVNGSTVNTSTAQTVTVPAATSNGTSPTVGLMVLRPSFTWSLALFLVTFHDTTTVTNGTESTVTWSFGDGGAVTAGTVQGKVNHTYAKPGLYSVTETVVGVPTGCSGPVHCGAQFSMSVEQVVTVGPATGSGSAGLPPAAAPTASFGPLQYGLILAGAAMLVTALATFGKPALLALPPALGAVVGGLTYWLASGAPR